MKRRQFGGTLASGLAGAGVAAPSQSARRPRKNTLMHVGGDYHSVAGPEPTSRRRQTWSTTCATASNISPRK